MTEQPKDHKSTKTRGTGFAVGLLIGLVLGSALGFATGNIILGAAVAFALGACTGLSLGKPPI
jgi:uncharacterized membrane protein YccC